MMNAKLVFGALGLVLIGLAVTVAPDLRRYLKSVRCKATVKEEACTNSRSPSA